MNENEAVKNNPDKFPERFSFIITDLEKINLWSKISTANISIMSSVNTRVFQVYTILNEMLKRLKLVPRSIK